MQLHLEKRPELWLPKDILERTQQSLRDVNRILQRLQYCSNKLLTPEVRE